MFNPKRLSIQLLVASQMTGSEIGSRSMPPVISGGIFIVG